MALHVVIRSAGSGEILAEFDEDEFQRMLETRGNTVKALKLALKDKGFGYRCRLRLLNDSGEMPDDEILVPPLDLRLLKMNLCLSDEAEDERFREACRDGRLEEVETRLKKLQDPNVATTEGRSALLLAAERFHLEVVRLLLEAGACSDRATQNGVTPLHFASMRGHLEMVRLLLAAGACCDRAMQDGTTPLHEATMRNHLEVVRLLVEAGACCDRARHDGATPLALTTDKEIKRLLRAFPSTKRRKVAG